MAPNEAAILNNYLLLPAQLPNIVTLQEFTSYFPKSQQSSPRVRALYRDMQQQRGAVVEAVSEGIAAQVHQGKALRRQVVRERREAEQDEQDDEVEIERTVCFVPMRPVYTYISMAAYLFPSLPPARRECVGHRIFFY